MALLLAVAIVCAPALALAVTFSRNIHIGGSSYLNFGSADGSSGYGIRDSGGTIQVKNSGGSWASIGTGSGTVNAAGNDGYGGCYDQTGGLYLSGTTMRFKWVDVYYCVQYATSDERLKRGIRDLGDDGGLDVVMKLRPVSFEWKDADMASREGEQLGFIAQDVEAILPQIVRTSDASIEVETQEGAETIANPKSIRYQALLVPLVKAVQELKTQVDEQAAQIQALRLGGSSVSSRESLPARLRSLVASVSTLFAAGFAPSDAVSPAYETTPEIQNIDSAATDSLTIGAPEAPAGFTMYDQLDGRAYCVILSGGALRPVPGACK